MTPAPVDFMATTPSNANGVAQTGAPPSGSEQSDDNDVDAPFVAPWETRITHATADWFAQAPPLRSWLLRDARRDGGDGVLPLGKAGQIVAEGGAGKTLALLGLALAVATGDKWLGTFSVASQGRVLLALGEEDAEEVRRRMFNVARSSGLRPPPADSIVTLPLAGVACPMIASDLTGDPVDAPFLHWLRAYLGTHGPWALVVVDPLSRFAGADAEKDNAAATRFVQALESLTPASGGATVLSSHHSNKISRAAGARVDTSSARGSTALTDGVRWVMTLGHERIELDDPDVRGRLGEIVTLSHTKSNYSLLAEPLLLRRDREHGGALLPLDDTDMEIVRQAKERPSTRVARTQQRETERSQVRDERERRDAERREAVARDRENATRRRDAEDDAAARECHTASPTAAVRVLVAQVKAARACGSDRALAAVHRVRGATS